MANKYLRSGASGTGSGDDWTNAYTTFVALESGLARGDTGYVADGTYTGATFNTAASGTTGITIKKASIADHGTETGWDNSYGDGQALVNGDFEFRTDYWVIDGAYRNEANWQDINAYGIRIKASNGTNTHGIWGNADNGIADNLTFRYLDIGGNADQIGVSNVPGEGFYLVGGTRSGISISQCHIHNTALPVLMNSTGSVTIEECWIGPSYHKEGIRGQATCPSWIIRNNVIQDNGDTPNSESMTAIIACFGNDPDTWDAWEIYGNVFVNTNGFGGQYNNGIIIGGGSGFSGDATNWKVYNNTFYNIRTGNPGQGLQAKILLSGTNNVCHNNIFVGFPSGMQLGISADDADTNFFYCPDASGLAAIVSSFPSTISGSSDPMVDAANGDYQLSESVPGTVLGAGFDDIDPLGNQRGEGGVWDVGVYQFDGTPPSGPTLNVTNFNATTLTVG